MVSRLLILSYQLWFLSVVVVHANIGRSHVGASESFNLINCGQHTCDAATQVCQDSMTCDCRPDFEFDPDNEGCHPCPGEGSPCKSCCYGGAVCHGGFCRYCWKDSNGECITQDSLFFLTAAQVALATAMVIGVAALATLLYKTFRARSRRANTSQQAAPESELQRSSRVSLTSIQIRVLRRLRDRPPKYETRHNYEFHQRERPENATPPADRQQPHTTTPVEEDINRTARFGDPPPAYDEDVTSIAEFPPPYSAELPHPEARIAVIEGVGVVQTTERNNSQLGVANRAFESDEETDLKLSEVMNREVSGVMAVEDSPGGGMSDSKTEGTDDINVSNSSEHKAIHI